MHPPSPTASRRALALVIIGAVLFVLTVALTLVGLASPAPPLACDFTKAILCAEFPSSGAAFDATLESAPNALWQWRLAVWLDMPFLVAYGALLALSARPLGARAGTIGWIGAAALGGAALDVAENIGILVATAPDPASDTLAAFTSLAASAKFTLLGLACAELAWTAAARRDAHSALLRGALGVGGLLALGGAAVGWVAPRAFEFGALGIAITCLTLWVRAIAERRRLVRA